MLTWLNRLCHKSATPMPAARRPPGQAAAAAEHDAPTAAAGDDPEGDAIDKAPVPEADAGCRCGWFDSSLDLRQGLAVSELADPDWTVMVLWFGPAALRRSARLH